METNNITEQERYDITHAVGDCLMMWSMVERNTSLIYNECICVLASRVNIGIHVAVFDSVISIRARHDMISAAIKARSTIVTAQENPFFELHEQWKRLAKKIKKKHVKRNEIAHSDIIQTCDQVGKQIVRLAPFPTFTNSRFTIQLTHTDLMERRDSFRDLAREVFLFGNQVRAARTLLPESL